jgi:outer membrane protein OmpA-like peptidoglycan-associated protein
VLEVGSHTDSRANDQYNLELSNKRAKYAVDYIVSRGIDKGRITGIGYGEKKLLNRCNNATVCPDEEHAKNRRTEFKLSFKEKAPVK